MEPSSERKIEFIAKTVTDVGKGVVLVGLASTFFEKFPFGWRIAISVASVVLIVVGIVVYPGGGKSK